MTLVKVTTREGKSCYFDLKRFVAVSLSVWNDGAVTDLWLDGVNGALGIRETPEQLHEILKSLD